MSIERFRNFGRGLLRSQTMRNIAKLLTGTGVAQILTFGTLLVTARIFSDTAFGELAVFTSVAAIITPVAALRYDLAVMLPDTDDEARRVVSLSRRAIAATALLTTIATAAFHGVIVDVTESRRLAFWLLLCGPSVFFFGETNLYRYWMNRMSDYGPMARNRVWLASGISAGQIGLGATVWRGSGALIIGHVLGQALAWVRAWGLTRQSRRSHATDPQPLASLAKRYVRMPLLNGTNTLVDAVRLNGINLLIGAESVAALGQYNMAWRLTMAPLGLVNSAISQVLFRSLARCEPGRMSALLRSILLRIAAVGVPAALAFFLLAPGAFPLVLGSEWSAAGDFARALSPWLLMMFLSSPISTVFIVTEWQGALLAFSVVYTAMPLAFVWYADLELLPLITIMSWILAGLLLVVVFMALRAARSYDARAET